jgi:hypothetical protein
MHHLPQGSAHSSSEKPDFMKNDYGRKDTNLFLPLFQKKKKKIFFSVAAAASDEKLGRVGEVDDKIEFSNQTVIPRLNLNAFFDGP